MSELRFEELLKIGDTAIRILFYEKEGPLNIAYVHLHGDEPGARDAAIEMVNRFGGRVISFLHDERRYIRFNIGRIPYEFDPNRMFHVSGIEASLKRTDKYSAIDHYSYAARDQIILFAQTVLVHYVQSPDIIIAPHNNNDGNYHIGLYHPQHGPLRSAISGWHARKGNHPGNFLYMNSPEHFRCAMRLGFNCVLQHPAVPEDGSLSVWCANKQHPYINCEADEEHIPEQIRMLEMVVRMLRREKEVAAECITADELTALQRDVLLAYDVQAGVSRPEHDQGWKELERRGLAVLHHHNGKVLYRRSPAGDRLYRHLAKNPV